MWIAIIILAVAALIGAANYSHRNEIKKKIQKEGGMLNKYKSLVDGLMKDDPTSQIFNTSGNKILLGISNPQASVLFKVVHDVDSVTVEYKFKPNYETNQRRLAWEFPENLDQMKMLEKIRFDIASDNLKMWGLLNDKGGLL